jgi:hypothetical protein
MKTGPFPAIALLFASSAICQVAIPPHSSVYNGYSRGYNFTAGVPFIITQLQLPPEAMQAGDTGSFLVRVNGATALRSVGVAGGSITPNLLINSGDVVDIIGNWSPAVTGNFTAHNSYTATSPNATTILGVPHNLTRTGWQWDIGDTAWASGTYLAPVAGSMGRIFMYVGAPAGFATATPYGTGCYDKAVSFYENFVGSNTFDLGSATSVNSIQMIPNGNGGYTVVPGGTTWWTPVGANLGLTDDSQSAALPMSFSFPYPGGSTSSIIVASNGVIGLTATGSTLSGYPTPAVFMTQGARLAPLWTDLDPGPTGAGTIVFDDDSPNGVVYVTWTGVAVWEATPSSPRFLNTFQVAMHSNGLVEYRYQSCSAPATAGLNTMTGFTPGGTARDPGNRDISATLPFTTSTDMNALALAASARPVLGASINLVTTNCATASVGANILSFTQHNPGLPLAGLGMPGCQQYVGLDAVSLFFPSGGTGSNSFSIPNNPAYAGMHVFSQSAAFVTGLNPLGVISSNGVDLLANPN